MKLPKVALPAVGAAAPLLQALGSSPLGSLVPGGLSGMAAAAAPQPRLYAQGWAGDGGSSSCGGGGSSGMWSSPAAATAGSNGSAALPSSSAGGSSARGASVVAAAAAARSPGGDGGGGGGGDGIDGLMGIWIKDTAASDLDSYGRACDLMQVSWGRRRLGKARGRSCHACIQHLGLACPPHPHPLSHPAARLQLSGLQKTTAMQLIEGVEMSRRGAEVKVSFLTVVPFFSVSEPLVLGGSTRMPRRDLRGGSQTGSVAAAPGGGLRVEIRWEEPNAGGVVEEYRLLDGGAALECLSTVSVAAGSVTTRSVFHRSERWKPRFQWNPLYALMRGFDGQ